MSGFRLKHVIPTPLRCLFLLSLVTFFSCEQMPEGLNWNVPFHTPRERYVQALESLGLGDSQLKDRWIEAGRNALEDSLEILPPHREVLFFQAAEPRALGYRIRLQEGERLVVRRQVAPQEVQCFVDLYQMPQAPGEVRSLVLSCELGLDSLVFEAMEAGIYHYRIQPELLADCQVTLEFLAEPIYGFPVQGRGNRAIGSFFGDPRDGGRRVHKGVDIFARRGTPVVAISPGQVRSVRNGGLGGKTVWVRDDQRSITQYYAHLDTQMVDDGQLVKPGDTLGLVGNTGNARTTPPHLHFGLYKRPGGAVDPQPYISIPERTLPEWSIAAADSRQDALRIGRHGSKVLSVPSRRGPVIREVAADAWVQILAQSRYYYRIRTADGLHGYIRQDQAQSMEEPLAILEPTENLPMHNGSGEVSVPVAEIRQGSKVKVLAREPNALYVEDAYGIKGWMPVSP